MESDPIKLFESVENSNIKLPLSAVERILGIIKNILVTLLSFFLIVNYLFLLVYVFFPAILTQIGLNFSPSFLDFNAVAALGALVGFVELISRYKDAPFQTAASSPGLIYMGINGAVAIAALLLIQLFGWNFIPGGDAAAANPEVERWTQILVAGLGAMAIFRSALFVIGKGEEEVQVGPNAVLEILLDAIDKEVDRKRGQKRAKLVKRLMKDLAYEDAKRDLPDLCRALMQNLRQEEHEKIGNSTKTIDAISNTSIEARKFQLGLKIMDIVGEDILEHAINIMKDGYDNEMFRNRRQRRAKLVNSLMKNISYEEARRDLPGLCKSLKQNLSNEQSTALDNVVNSLDSISDTSEESRKIQLGLNIMKIMGEEVLENAIEIMLADFNETKETKLEEKPSGLGLLNKYSKSIKGNVLGDSPSEPPEGGKTPLPEPEE